MSDYRAIAGVTVALQQLLHGPADLAWPGAVVRVGMPPKDPQAGATGLVNVFLYQVRPNPNWRNAELPVRRSDGSLAHRPQAALDLDYVLSFYGDEGKLVPQLLLGKTISTLHAHPQLTPQDIPRLLDGKSLADSGLSQQAEVLQFMPQPLNLDEMSKLWSTLIQVPYALSAVYRCSVVLIEADLTPQPLKAVKQFSAKVEVP